MATTPSSPATPAQATAVATEVAATPAAEAVVLQTAPEKKPVDTSIAAVAAAEPIPVSGNANLSTKEALFAKAKQEAERAEAEAAQKKADAAPPVAVIESTSTATITEPGVVGVGTGPVAPSAEVLAAIAADKAQQPLAVGTAGVVAELSTVGTGDAIASIRPDQTFDPAVRQVGPGAAALTTLKVEQVASDEKVKVTFPSKVVLTRQDYSRVEFPAGQSEIPVEYLTHPYLIASGMKVVPEVGKQTPVVVQAGTVAPVAPVK